MKTSIGAAAALAAVTATAQLPPSYDDPVWYTTVTIDDCPTASFASLITVTNGMTVTYCPDCEDHGSSPTTAAALPVGPGYTTIYTTTYMSLCPTGVVPATYTVTESCTDATPTWTPGPGYIPGGFTVTEKECTVCGTATPTITITEPCGCEATGGVPVRPTGAPVQQISDGQAEIPTAALPAYGGSGAHPADPTAVSCNGRHCGGSGHQSPGQADHGDYGIPPAPGSSRPSLPGSYEGGSHHQSPPGSYEGGSPNQSPPGSYGGDSPPLPESYQGGYATDAGTDSADSSSRGSAGIVAPHYSTSQAVCSGSECHATATHTARPSSTDNADPSDGPPFEGRASSSHLGLFTSITLSLLVGGVAFAL